MGKIDSPRSLNISRKKVINEVASTSFERDISNLAGCAFVRGRTLLADERIEQMGFPLSATLENVKTSRFEEALQSANNDPEHFLLLTVGACFYFPDRNDIKICARETYYAEIHASCYETLGPKPKVEYKRISLYRIQETYSNSLQRSRTLVARFEGGIEIHEDNLKPGERLLDPANYSNVGSWNSDCRAEGINVGTTVCHAVSRAEVKFNLKFPESLYFLQKKETVINADGSFITNLGDKELWEGEAPKPSPAPTATKVRKPKPTAAYVDQEEIGVIFFYIVIRNDALNMKYPGGIKAYLADHPYCSFNNDITTDIAMDASDLDAHIEDLKSHGLKEDVDYFGDDWSTLYLGFQKIEKPVAKKVSMPVDWLKARTDGHKLFIKLSKK